MIVAEYGNLIMVTIIWGASTKLASYRMSSFLYSSLYVELWIERVCMIVAEYGNLIMVNNIGYGYFEEKKFILNLQ